MSYQSRGIRFTTRRGDSFNPQHEFKPGDIIFSPRSHHNSVINGNIYMYVKTTEKCHHLLRLLSFDFQDYFSKEVTQSHKQSFMHVIVSSWKPGERIPKIRHTCLAAKVAYPSAPGPEHAKSFHHYLSNYQNPDFSDVIHKCTSHIKDISGFLPLERDTVDASLSIFCANLDVALSFKGERFLTNSDEAMLIKAYKEHLDYILPKPLPRPIDQLPLNPL